jgi:hypothetical protein
VEGRRLTRDRDEEIVTTLVDAARRTGEHLEHLRRLFGRAQVVRCGAFELELRGTDVVALRRTSGPAPLWRRRADAARRELRRKAASGDRAAAAALRDLGEEPPPVRHWADTDDDRAEQDGEEAP